MFDKDKIKEFSFQRISNLNHEWYQGENPLDLKQCKHQESLCSFG